MDALGVVPGVDPPRFRILAPATGDDRSDVWQGRVHDVRVL